MVGLETAPPTSTGENVMLDRVKNWLAQPFSENMDAYGWALFVLFLMVVAFLWTRVLKLVTGE